MREETLWRAGEHADLLSRPGFHRACGLANATESARSKQAIVPIRIKKEIAIHALDPSTFGDFFGESSISRSHPWRFAIEIS